MDDLSIFQNTSPIIYKIASVLYIKLEVKR